MFDKTVLKIIKKKKKVWIDQWAWVWVCEPVAVGYYYSLLQQAQPNPTQRKGILVILILGEFNSYI